MLTCPYCKETDFDEIGLRLHLTIGWCPVFMGNEENLDNIMEKILLEQSE